MNHRDRVMAAIGHQQADRVPVDLGGMASTGIMASAYADLKRHLGISTGAVLIFDGAQQLAVVEEPVRRQLGCDVLVLDAGMLAGWSDYALGDGTPAKIRADFRTEPDGQGGQYGLDCRGRRAWHRPETCAYFKSIHTPLAGARTPADIKSYDWPVLTDQVLTRLQNEAKRLYQDTDYALVGPFGGAFLEGGQSLRGWANFLMDLSANRVFAEALLDRMLDHYLQEVERYLDAVGDYIQIIQLGGDLGTQQSPQIRPEMYYEIIQPRQKTLWGRIHELAPRIAVFLHSCGSIYELIPGIIDAGCDVLNPVQISARGMDPARLKQEFGRELCFWGGGCDTQSVLPHGTPEEVYEHTRRNIEILKPGGGFVFCQVHNIQCGVPPENIMAMYEAVRAHGTY